MDDTLSSEGVDKSLLNAVKDSIVQVPMMWHASAHVSRPARGRCPLHHPVVLFGETRSNVLRAGP
jgi:hypothetical protein